MVCAFGIWAPFLQRGVVSQCLPDVCNPADPPTMATRTLDSKNQKHRCAVCTTIAKISPSWQRLALRNGRVVVGERGTLPLHLDVPAMPVVGGEESSQYEENWLCGACRTKNGNIDRQSRPAGGSTENVNVVKRTRSAPDLTASDQHGANETTSSTSGNSEPGIAPNSAASSASSSAPNSAPNSAELKYVGCLSSLPPAASVSAAPSHCRPPSASTA